MYTKEDLTPENDKEKMLVMALLRKCRGKCVCIMDGEFPIKSLNSSTIRIDAEYKKPAPKKLNIPWEFIKDEFTCAAMDRSGDVWLHEGAAKIENKEWHYGSGCELITSALKIDTTDIDWKESLTFRPGA